MLIIASFLSVLINSYITFTVSIAPVAPIGCPMEIPPPKISSEKLADKLGLDLKSIDMFEINEAFASQAYAVSRDLGLFIHQIMLRIL